MAEYMDVMMQQKRMCRYYEKKNGSCDECPLHEEKISYMCAETPCVIENEHVEQAEKLIMEWAEEHPEPVYPTWSEWLLSVGGGKQKSYEVRGCFKKTQVIALNEPIPEETAMKLGVKPKEGS